MPKYTYKNKPIGKRPKRNDFKAIFHLVCQYQLTHSYPASRHVSRILKRHRFKKNVFYKLIRDNPYYDNLLDKSKNRQRIQYFKQIKKAIKLYKSGKYTLSEIESKTAFSSSDICTKYKEYQGNHNSLLAVLPSQLLTRQYVIRLVHKLEVKIKSQDKIIQELRG